MGQAAYADYELCIDLNGDRDFGDANEDVSAYVMSATCQHGMGKPWEEMGRSATMTFVLDNVSGLFSPGHASALSGFDKGCLCRLRMTYSGTTVTRYLGRIDSIEVMPGTRSRRRVTVRCEGYIRQLQEGEVAIPAMQEAASDELIAAILQAAGNSPQFVTGWRLGVSGFSELGSTTTLGGGVTEYAVLDAGVGQYAYAGDNWRNGVSPYRAIRDVVMAERGKLFEDQDGYLRFWNRHRLLTDLANAVDATLTGAVLQEADFQYGEDAINAVEVNYTPRRLSGVQVLGTADEPIAVSWQRPVTVTVRFNEGETGARISGLNVITPLPHVDWQANRHRRGRTWDMTKYIGVTMVASGDKAELTFTMNQKQLRIFVVGVQVRGQKLLDSGRQKIVERDDASITSYGLNRRTIDSTILQDLEEAQNIAKWELAARSTPTGNLRSVSFLANGSATLMGHARDRRIGDRVALSETQTAANGEWYIVGMLHEMRPRFHKTTWILEPKSATKPWLLGVSGYCDLGTTTKLGV